MLQIAEVRNVSKMSRLLIALSLGLLILVGCTAHRAGTARRTAVATPIPPPELLTLPANAQIECDDNPNYRSDVFLWELPGLEPVDPESSSGGNTGKRLGLVKACTVVRVTDYAWSEADQAFYVHIEMDSLKGWLTIDFLDFMP
jgi:hypothetical protein